MARKPQSIFADAVKYVFETGNAYEDERFGNEKWNMVVQDFQSRK